MNLTAFLEDAIENLGTEQDAERGFRDVSIRTSDGKTHTVRLSAIAPRFKERVQLRYMASEDPKDIVRAMLDPKFAKDDFLNSIIALDLVKLSNAAAGLLMGPEMLKQLLRQRLGLKGVS